MENQNKVVKNKSIEQQQIEKIFEEYKNENRSNESLAELLNSVIQTSLSGSHKFLFELLQNADDAEIEIGSQITTSIEMDFILQNQHLIVRHNGKQFDNVDVDKICRTASTKYLDKRNDSTKTGHKDIGFKTLFGISNYIAIFSNNYNFRFDKSYFPNPKNHPWQVMPIWSTKQDIVPEISAYIVDLKVNFILKLNPKVDLGKEMDYIVQNPQLILFLRRVKSIRLVNEKKEFIIHCERKTTGENFVEVKLFVNKLLHSTWLVSQFNVQIPSNRQEELQQLDGAICPERLKNAEKTSLYYAARLVNNKLTAELNATLYTTLPTGEQCGLPFLVNGEFLLNQDRTELLDLGWNQFLLDRIGYTQFVWLKTLAEFEQTRFQVLTMLSVGTIYIKNRSEKLQQAFSGGFKKGSEDIAWIPAFDPISAFHKLNECILDEVGFFAQFQMDEKITKQLISNQLVDTKKLRVHISPEQIIDFDALLKRLGQYILSHKESDFNYQLLLFLKNKSHNNSDYVKKISQTNCLLTQHGIVIKPTEAYFPTNDNAFVPSVLISNLIKPEVIGGNKELSVWLTQLGAKETTRIKIIRGIIFKWIEENKVPVEHHFEIVRFLFTAFCKKEFTVEDYEILSNLQLHTQANNVLCHAKFSYLADSYNPKLKLEKSIPDPSSFVFAGYSEKLDDIPHWKEFFLKIKVKGKIEINFIASYCCLTAIHDKGNVMDEYFSYIKSEYNYPKRVPKSYNNHYLRNFVGIDFIKWMKFPAYASSFWQEVQKKWADIKKYGDETSYYYSAGPKQITPFFSYYFRKFSVVLAKDGSLYKSEMLYAPYLSDVVGELFLVAAIQEQLTEEQAKFFGFKTQITYQDGIQFLKHYKNYPEKAKPKNYAIILTHLLHLNPEDKVLFQKESTSLYLFAENNSLQLVTQLMYVDSEQFKPPSNSSTHLKCLPGLNREQMRAICQFFGIKVIQAETKKIVPVDPIEESSLRDFIYKKLPLITLQESHFKNEDVETIFSLLIQRVNVMKCYSVSNLSLTYDSESPSTKLLCYRDDNLFYYVGRWNKSSAKYHLLTEVAHYLDIQSSKDDLLGIFKLKEDGAINEWLQDRSYSVKVYSNLKNKLTENPQDVSLTLSNSSFELNISQRVTNNLFDTSLEKELEKEIDSSNVITSNIDFNESEMKLEEDPISPISSYLQENNNNNSSPFLSVKTQKNLEIAMKNITPDLYKKPSISLSHVSDSTSHFKPAVDAKSVNLKSIGFFRIKPNVNTTIPTQVVSSHAKISNSSNKPRNNKLKEEKKREIGRWSEEVVNSFLKDRYETHLSAEAVETDDGFCIKGNHHKSKQLTAVEVVWCNKNGESGKSYDFIIKKSKKEIIVEVKGTSSDIKRNFEISANEVEIMKTPGIHYQIFRLFNAGKKEDVRIEKIKDPAKEIHEGTMKLEPKIYMLEYSLKK